MIKCFDSDLSDKEKDSLSKVIDSKILAFGPLVGEFESAYKKFSNKQYNIGFNSASAAAYVLFEYLYHTYGSCKVYTTSLGFVSPVYAAIKNHHEVIYVDVDENLLLCHESLNEMFENTKKKSVVMPVLYGGVSGIKNINAFCLENDCLLVLDSAHCISPSIEYDYAFYSFHPVKPICMSNGGLLATNDKHTADFMYKGRNFGRQQIEDTYDLVQPGFNFYMNNLNASLGLCQLEKCLENVEKRKRNFNFIKDSISSYIGHFAQHDENSSYYLSSLVLKNSFYSDKMRRYLKEKGIQSSFHYPFLHTSKQYGVEYKLPNLENLSNRIINLPIHQNLQEQELEKIVNECVRYSRSGG